MTGMEHAIEHAARVLALTDNYDGCFERIDAWEDATDEQRECGDVEEPMTSDEEDCEFWRRRARALAEAGLLVAVPPPTETDKVARRWHEGSDHAADGEPFGGPLCNCMKVAERLCPMLHQEWGDGWGFGWRSGQKSVDRAEGDGRAAGHE